MRSASHAATGHPAASSAGTLVLVVLTSLTSGCGGMSVKGSFVAHPQAASDRACSLITTAEASNALGAPATAPLPGLSLVHGGQSCGYLRSSHPDPSVGVGIEVFSGMSGADFANGKWSVSGSGLPVSMIERLGGIADEAVITSGQAAVTVAFRKGADVAVITLLYADAPSSVRDLVVSLAKEAAPRL